MTTPASSPSPGYYVPQLDGLRYFAFLLVFLSHLPLAESLLVEAPPLRALLVAFNRFGWVGVDLFLVLSAFLITNLLLLEQQRCGRFSLKDFYIRRSLRIWPLYFLMVAVGFFINPLVSGKWGSPEHLQLLQQHLGAYLAFLGNYSAGWFDYADSKYLAHLWTISLEEQFYLLWPLLLFLLIDKKPLLARMLWVLLGVAVYLRVCAWAAELPHPLAYAALPTRMDALALGSLLALHRFQTPPALRWAWLKTLSGVLLVASIAFFPPIETLSAHGIWQYSAVAFGFTLILDSALSGGFVLQNRILSQRSIVWMGKICYGLYVYHLIGLKIGKSLVKALHLSADSGLAYLALLLAGHLVTVLLAAASYRYFEKPFLKLKHRFTHIASRPA